MQTNFIPDGATPPNYTTHTSVDPLQPVVRGVRSWNTIACVQNGDLSVPGTIWDDRYTKMNATPLTGNNLKPLAMSGFVFGP